MTSAVNVCRWFTASVALEGETVTPIAAVNVIVALAETLGLALLLALTVTEPPSGRVCGAVYVVLLGLVCEFRIVPAVALPPTAPFTDHVTVESCAPVTVACNATVPPSATVAAVGDTETPNTGTMETEIETAFDGSACGVATMFTIAGDGASEGAVYTPPDAFDELDEIVPHAEPVQPVPETLQEIVRLGFEFAAGVSVAV